MILFIEHETWALFICQRRTLSAVDTICFLKFIRTAHLSEQNGGILTMFLTAALERSRTVARVY